MKEEPPGTVRQGQAGGYFCKAASIPGTWYLVWGDKCTCKAGAAGVKCKHLRYVAAFVKALDAQYKRPAAPVNVSAMVD